MHKRIEGKDSNKYLYTHVHSSIIHNSQKEDTIQVSITGRVNKQQMAYIEWNIIQL